MIKLKDPFSCISHLIGMILAIIGTIFLIVYASTNTTAYHIVSFSIYGTTLILLFLFSSLYHMLNLSEGKNILFKKLDHIMIYMLIAGTYTPLCLVTLKGGWGWSMFGVVWGMALLGLVLKLFFINIPRYFSTLLYLCMGWVALIPIYPLVKILPISALIWLFLGGLLYSVGAVIYAIKKPNFWPGVFGFHEIWHLFVLAASFCFFWVMFDFVLKM